jgi:hypothetical protein
MGRKGGVNGGNAFADPAHDRDGHGVAAGFVAWAVGTLLLGLTLPADARPVVGESLEAFAFDWRQATDGHSADERDIASACSELGGDSRGYLKRASDAGVLSVVFVDFRLGYVIRLVRSGQGDGPDLIAEQTDFLALVLRPCDRLHDGMSRPGVAEVEVV